MSLFCFVDLSFILAKIMPLAHLEDFFLFSSKQAHFEGVYKLDWIIKLI